MNQSKIHDVCIVGAGAAGTCAAYTLAAQGLGVVLVDPHAECAPCFKAEKLEPDQVKLLEQMHLFTGLSTVLSPIRRIVIYNGSAIVDAIKINQYGMRYEQFVNQLRRMLPATVVQRRASVVALTIGELAQTVRLNNGEQIQARLVVLASGTDHRLSQALGIKRRDIAPKNTVAFGFDVVLASGALPHDGTNFLPDDASDRVGFLTLFPTPELVRANLFTYCDPHSAWSKQLRSHPRPQLLSSFSQLQAVIGGFEVQGKVSGAVIDLWTTPDPHIPGVVLIGDAFQSVCPATGTGLSKLLTDVSLLSELAPQWLASAGMGADKLRQYYGNMRKRGSDRQSLRAALYSRHIATETSVRSSLARLRRAVGVMVRGVAGVSGIG